MSEQVFVELNDHGRIDVDWGRVTPDVFNRNANGIRQIAGRRFVKTPHKHWTVPLDMTTCRLLRKVYGSDLVVGPALRSWAVEAKRAEDRLGTIALSDSGTLVNLKDKLPRLYRALYLGPLAKNARDALGYSDKEINAWVRLMASMTNTVAWDPTIGSYQTADVRFLSDSPSPLNANQQGLGKTPEWIATVYEAGLEEGCHLILAPSAAVDGTWEPELEMWQAEAGDSVEVFACTGSRVEREATLAAFMCSTAKTRWVVVNPQMIQYRKQDDPFGTPSPIARKARPKEWIQACKCSRMKDPHWHYVPTYPELMEVQWTTICVDEAHKGNIRNHRSLTSFSVNDLLLAKGGKRSAMSGTPMKKKGADIWGLLHWLRPDVFTSFWRFAELFFEIDDNGFGKKVGELRPDMEAEFFEYLKPYVVRRTKAECLPWLPLKQYIDVPVVLRGKQAKQYAQMSEDGVARLANDTEVSTTSVLAEFTRLTQFANAYCDVRDGKVVPTRESAKLDAMWQKLEEAGILDGSSNEQTVIFSQSREMIELVAEMLREQGVSVATITGGMTKRGARRSIREAFQAGQIRVLCVVTTAGGVSLTLDAADSAHFIDTSWAPDDDEQAEDRTHRASRIHQVRIYRYYATGTIDEVKMDTAMDKAAAHSYILDVRRKLLKESA